MLPNSIIFPKIEIFDMSAITDNVLQELKDLINKRFDRLGENITELKVEIGKNQQNLAGLDKRLVHLPSFYSSILICKLFLRKK